MQDVDSGLVSGVAVLLCDIIFVGHSACVYAFVLRAAGRNGASDVDMDRSASCRTAVLDAFSVVPRVAWVDLVVVSRGLLDLALACSIVITIPWFWPGPSRLRIFSLQP